MTAILTTLKDKQGNTLYPLTKTNAVSDSNGTSLDSLLSGKVSASQLLNLVYPIGSIYIGDENSSSPASWLGGTWQQIEDKFLLASGNSYTAGDTGGEAEHTLTINEMPAHTHTAGRVQNWDATTSSRTPGNTVSPNASTQTSSTGGGQAHNNMPPYLVVYMWKRTA